MRFPLAPLVSLITALSLAVAMLAQGYALAQPRMGELVAVVICAETGAKTVHIDARGNVTDPATCDQGLCPDCLPVSPLAVGDGPDLTALPAPRQGAIHPSNAVLARARIHPARLPRGPPDLA